MRMNFPKISVVLPVYNGEKYLSIAVESILKQTYPNWELICVNDCSTDRTQEILERYAQKDDRIKMIQNAVNLKLPASLNVGFRHAKGEYLTWTSDDNYYAETALQTLAEKLQADQADMVYADYVRIDAEGKEQGVSIMGDPDQLLLSNCVGACFLYTREIAETVGEYDTNAFLAEDYDYWLRIYRYGKIRHIHEAMYYYRIHDGRLTVTKKNQICTQTRKVLEKNFLFLLSKARELRQEYQFLNYFMSKAEDSEKDSIRTMLYRISIKYRLRDQIKKRGKRWIHNTQRS